MRTLTFAFALPFLFVATILPATADDDDNGGVAPHLKAWSKQIDDADRRFKVLKDFDREAVLDKETQLVWEREPSTDETGWVSAINECLDKTVGGRKGWRLPTTPEVMSLIDPSGTVFNPALPPGHPFIVLGNTQVWTAERLPGTDSAQVVDIQDGALDAEPIDNVEAFWCVRGGNGGPSYNF